MSFPRYPKYKDSGVEWLGAVPAHWEVWKLAHAFELIGSGTTPKTDNREYYDDGDIPWVNTGDLNDGGLDDCEKRITPLALAQHSSLKTYPAGSLLIAMYGATIGKLAMLRFPSTVNQACCVFAGKSEIMSKFMFYWFLGLRQQILSLATGGGQPNISQDILRTLRVACPDHNEQTQIAAFLDRETAKIDELVAEQRRLMELLKEKRQAVISHTVTQGLNPDAPMKPSGIEWLGDVPAHWEVVQFKQFVDIQNGSDHKHVEQTEGYPVLGSGGVFTYASEFLYDGESVLLGRKGTIDKPLHIIGRFWTVDTMYWTKISPDVSGRFTYYLALTIPFDFYSTNTALPSMTKGALSSHRVAFPPLPEQTQIAAFLDRETAKLDTLTAEAQRAIDLLQERRTALISAAVTGQIDVRACSIS